MTTSNKTANLKIVLLAGGGDSVCSAPACYGPQQLGVPLCDCGFCDLVMARKIQAYLRIGSTCLLFWMSTLFYHPTRSLCERHLCECLLGLRVDFKRAKLPRNSAVGALVDLDFDCDNWRVLQAAREADKSVHRARTSTACL